jgi:hypothetical protein
VSAMAKIPGTFAAVERYELVRDRVAGGVDPAVPEDAVRHACLLPEEPWIVGSIWAKIADATEPIFAEKGHGMDAACGRWVKVYLAEPLDSAHPKVCQRCMDAIGVKGS